MIFVALSTEEEDLSTRLNRNRDFLTKLHAVRARFGGENVRRDADGF